MKSTIIKFMLALFFFLINKSVGADSYFNKEISKKRARYELIKPKCSDAIEFEKILSENSPSTVIFIIGCNADFIGIKNDLMKITKKYKLKLKMADIDSVVVNISTMESLKDSIWSYLIKEVNQSKTWDYNHISINSNIGIHLWGDSYKFIRRTSWMKNITNILEETNYLIDFPNERGFSELVPWLSKEEIIKYGILSDAQANKKVYPYGFIFNLNCKSS